MEVTLCNVISGNRILLKKATRGISKGKWNGLGGKIEPGERPKESAIREVREESGLAIRDIRERGIIYFYVGSEKKPSIKMYLFSATKFTGMLTEGEEGKLRWFYLDSIPYDGMWDDDRFWWPVFLNGISFRGDFFLDKTMKRVISYRISKISR